ncbi:MAG TPA: cyclic nucleotide-binding domain-containing protein [Candidatus Acidoferrales bacterium]|nr:cyclic nucleotide-binding domain-containing protein [Candidatus Acidoferrales bacterium]
MNDLISLKKIPLFSTLSLEQLASIDRLLLTRRYLKGEEILRTGDLKPELHVIVEGEVRLHHDGGGRQLTLAHLGPGGFLGEMTLFANQPRPSSVQAVTDCVVRVLRKDRFEAIVHEHPEVLVEVIKHLCGRLRQADEQLQGVTLPAPAQEEQTAAAG